jgi:hypothetical protein
MVVTKYRYAALLCVLGLTACGATQAVSTSPRPRTVVECHGPPVRCARLPAHPQTKPPVRNTLSPAVRWDYLYFCTAPPIYPEVSRAEQSQVRHAIHHLCRTGR